MYNNEEKGLYMPVTIGKEEGKIITQNWHITTNDYMMGVFDEICIKRGCVNSEDPHSTDLLINDTITNGHRIPGSLTNEAASFNNEEELYDNF